MSEYSAGALPPPDRALSRVAAIVGLGETDYAADYQAARAKAPGRELPTPESLARIAFERALADSGLARGDIDGLGVSFIYGGAEPTELAKQLGIRPRYLRLNSGIMSGPLQIACAAIAAGEADTIALVYAAASRAIGRTYGGATYGDVGGMPSSYYYYHPWGWSSQAAHWAFIAQYYANRYGTTEADLGAVAVQLRHNAGLNPNAIMRKPLTIDDYCASRYIVRPLHLYDMCLVNDGAVCLIVRRSDMARDAAKTPVGVAGWGEAKVPNRKLHHLVRERLRPQLQESSRQTLEMAGLTLGDIGHVEAYDASSIHLVDQIEGLGFVEPGAGLAAFAGGELGIGGRLPVNTGGGMMSGSYMHGWNLVAEAVRQLRHEAGERQVVGVQASLFSMAETDQVHPIAFVRGV